MCKSNGEPVDHIFSSLQDSLRIMVFCSLLVCGGLGYAKFYDWLIGMDTLETWLGLNLEVCSFVLDVDLEVKECIHFWRQWAISGEADKGPAHLSWQL